MKIRNGFVSNSSSSSFVVLFPKKISNYDELFKMMWTEENMKRIQKQWNFNSKQGYANISVSFEEFQIWATNTILNDIKTQKENDYLRAIYLISHSEGYYDDKTEEFKYDNYTLKSTKDIKKISNEKLKIDNLISNFDWDIFSDDYYDSLSELSDGYDWIDNIENSLTELEDIIKSNKNKIFYSFSFSDEDGTYFSIIEHGRIFGYLPTYVESFH